MPRKRGAADGAATVDAANDASVSAPNLASPQLLDARAADTCDKEVCLGVGWRKLGALFGNCGPISLVLVLFTSFFSAHTHSMSMKINDNRLRTCRRQVVGCSIRKIPYEACQVSSTINNGLLCHHKQVKYAQRDLLARGI